MKALQGIRTGLNAVLKIFIIVLFAAMVIIGTYQIVARYFFNRPSTVTEELLTYSFAWLSLFSAAYVFGKRDHMRMGFLADKIKGRKRLVLELLIELVILIFAAVIMVAGGISIVKLTMGQMTASLGIPRGYVYMALPLSGVCIVIYNAINILEMLITQSADLSSYFDTTVKKEADL
ncbi:MAG: TRAP transporter small permease [Anaerovoracaceae bacterium]|jgi:TRAP-type C4-dicarboxylate transport system permease small subunit